MRVAPLIAPLACIGCTSLAGLDGLQFLGAEGGAGAAGGQGGGAAEGGGGAGGACACAGPSSYATEVLADAPLMYWRLGESGTPGVAEDASPHGTPGSYSGGEELGRQGAIACDPNTAAGFDGATTHVSAGDMFDFVGTAPFSLEIWFLHEGQSDTGRLVSKEEASAGYGLRIAFGGDIVFERNGEIDDENFPTGVFHHVVAVFEDQLRLYTDGVRTSAGIMSMSMLPDHAGAFTVGGTATWFEGVLDEVAVYDVALSEERIEAHWLAAQCP